MKIGSISFSLFYYRSKMNRQGLAPIYCKILSNGKVKICSTRVFVNELEWTSQFQEIKDESSLQHKLLEIWKNKLMSSLIEYYAGPNRDVDLDALISSINGLDRVVNVGAVKWVESCLEFVSKMKIQLGKEYSQSTYKLQPMVAAIRIMGDIMDTVEANILFAFRNGDGILSQNSSGNRFNCNATDYTQIGINILDNAASQHIESNQLEGSMLYDLSVSSEIGDQEHLGNDFIGGSVIANLSQAELDNSKFFVNDNDTYHFPPDRTPADGWFLSEDLPDATCTGIIGPSFTFFDNENALCKYYNNLKKLALVNKQKYLINLGHILKYANTRDGFTLPDCIVQDSTFNTICGLEEMINLITMVPASTQIIEYNTSSEYNTSQEREQLIDSLRNNYIQDTSWGVTDSIRLDSIRQEIILINCPDSLILIMQDVWVDFIDLIQNKGHLDGGDSSLVNIRTIAQMCSSEYGEAVHMARSILVNYGDYTYYDVYDNCTISLEQRSSQANTKLNEMVVQPNPSSGKVTIKWNDQHSGNLIAYNTSGIKFIDEIIIDQDKYDLNLFIPGVYIASFTNKDGIIENKRFIIIN